MIQIHAACSPGEVRILVTTPHSSSDGSPTSELLDAALWRPGCPDGLGDRHIVRVQTIVPHLGGAFVVLENGESGFMSYRRRPDSKMPEQGRLVIADVVRAAQNGKGLRLSMLDGKPLENNPSPARIKTGVTPLEELLLRYPEAPVVIDAPGMIARLPAVCRSRCQRVQAAFDTEQEAAFESLGLPDAPLGSLVAHFAPTPALVAIDLDSAGSGVAPDFAANVAAFPSLAREIRLRNISGTVLIDAAGVRTRKRPALVGFLEKAMAGDPLAPIVLGTTPSGLIEVTRRRARPPLYELLASPHGVALAMLRQIVKDGQRGTRLTVAISVARALEKDPQALADAETARAAPLDLVVEPGRPLTCWSLT